MTLRIVVFLKSSLHVFEDLAMGKAAFFCAIFVPVARRHVFAAHSYDVHKNFASKLNSVV